MTSGKENNVGKTSLWSKNYTFLFLSNFFLFFGGEMLSPVLPVYISQNGGNNMHIGLIMSIFTISAIVMRLFVVKLSDHFGKRAILIAGLIICALAACGYYIMSLLVVVFLFRVLHGIGFGAATTLYGGIVSNIIPQGRMGEGMGYFGLGITIAAAIGPFLGAMVVSSDYYSGLFLLSGGLIVISILLTKFTTAGSEPKEREKKSASKIRLSDFLEVRALLPGILAMIFGISMSGLFTFLVLFGYEVNIKSIGIFFLLNSLAEFLVRPVAGKLYDRKGHFVVLVPGAVAGIAGTLLLAFSTGLPMLIASALVCGAALGALFPVLEAWTMKSVEPERRVAASATFYNFLDVGVGLGALALGAIAHVSDYKTMYIYSSLAYVLFLIVYLVRYKKNKTMMIKEEYEDDYIDKEA